MKKGLLLFVIIIAYYKLQAQPKPAAGSHTGITGKVVDSTSGEPLNFATITLFAAGYEKPLKGTTTDAKGSFTINDVPDGNYKVVS